MEDLNFKKEVEALMENNTALQLAEKLADSIYAQNSSCRKVWELNEYINKNCSISIQNKIKADAVRAEVENLHNLYPHLDGPHLGILTHRANKLERGEL